MAIETNPITNVMLEHQRARAISVFPDLQQIEPADYASLGTYADGTPERFANLEARSEALLMLRAEAADRDGLLGRFLRDYRGELDIAFRALREVNLLQESDDPWPGPSALAEFSLVDRDVNPAYLKLSEAVLSTFLLPFAVRERRLRQKSTADIPFHQRIEEARRTPLEPHLRPFDRTIRNAIAHGTVVYGALDITYQDRSGSREISAREMVLLHDSLLDTCNGLAAALRTFFLLEQPWTKQEDVSPPLQMLLDEVRAQAGMPGWVVSGALEMDTPGTGRQLNLLIQSRFFDQLKSNYCCVVTAAVAERFLPGFNRYFLSVAGRTTGWARFDGSHLAALRRDGAADPAQLDAEIVIFPPFMNRLLRVPRILGRLGSLWQALRSHWSVAGEKRWAIDGTRVKVRLLKIHRKQYYAAIDAYIVVDSELQSSISFVRQHARTLFWLTSLLARAHYALRSSAAPLPLGYGTVNVFLSDFRLRQLESYGLGDQLLCRLTLKRLGRVKSVPLFTSIPETVQGCHVDWNSNAVSEAQLGEIRDA